MNDNANDALQDRKSVIIPPEEHPLLEKDIEPEALKVLYTLRDAGYSGYLVGGGVRDLYLGNRPKDFDISTNARPGQLRKLFRNSRTIGRRFRLVQVFFRNNKIIEVSTLRSQSEYDGDDAPDKVLPANNTFGTLEEDAFRRDLTINSLFYEIEKKTVIDYVGGVQDLADGIIRIVGDPERRIIRDPVRMLRAVRHAARNGFTIEEKTWQAIARHVDKIDLCPVSRIRDELLKDLQSGASRAWAEIAVDIGMFSVLFPCYGELLAGPDSEAVKKELFSMLAVLDRIFFEGGKIGKVVIDDALIFAILLFPWAGRRYGLLQEQKGAGYHRLVKSVREGLDNVFARRFNLKRMTIDSITTLFVNMSAFQKYQGANSWPGWLQKKSYFANCSRFSACCREATAGGPIDLSLFVKPAAVEGSPLVREQPPLRTTDTTDTTDAGSVDDLGSPLRRDSGRRGGNNPAFTSHRHGVFGLRKG